MTQKKVSISSHRGRTWEIVDGGTPGSTLGTSMVLIITGPTWLAVKVEKVPKVTK